MTGRLVRRLVRALRPGPARPAGGGTAPGRAPRRPPAPPGDVLSGFRVEYSPRLDGDADPGEIVWTWVPFEDDPSQGKDRPVVVIGRRGSGSRGHLVGVALTSKHHDHPPQVPVGTGPWDREGRPSWAKVDRLIDVDPRRVRREGAVLDRDRFDAVVAGVRRHARR